MSTTITIPDLGGAESVSVIELFVSEGDQLEADQALITVESDKAAIDIPTSTAGQLVKLLVAVGDEVGEGDPIAEVQSSDEVSETDSSEGSADGAQANTNNDGEVHADADAKPDNSNQTESSSGAQTKDSSTSNKPAPNSSDEDSTHQTKQTPDSKKPPSHSKEQASTSSQTAAQSESSSDTRSARSVYAGPAARKLARELGVNLETVTAHGPKDRVLKSDVQQHVKDALFRPGSSDTDSGSAGSDIDFSQFGEVDIQSTSKLKQLTAKNMHQSWSQIPHVTQFDEADITELMEFRQTLRAQMQERKIKLSPLPFVIKALCSALKANPAFNASLSGDLKQITYKKYVHIGVAVDTEHGLFVPVIRHADQKGVWELGEEIEHLATLAQNRKLSPDQMKGGCFTVSSLGPIGGQGFTPIINPPEVGILGVSNLKTKPVYIENQLVPRKLLPLTLSYDHRAINGADAGRFLTDLVRLLGDTRQLIL